MNLRKNSLDSSLVLSFGSCSIIETGSIWRPVYNCIQTSGGIVNGESGGWADTIG
jgi:hypothetical protein